MAVISLLGRDCMRENYIEEFKILEQILGHNQSLKTKLEEMNQKVFDIQNAINARR